MRRTPLLPPLVLLLAACAAVEDAPSSVATAAATPTLAPAATRSASTASAVTSPSAEPALAEQLDFSLAGVTGGQVDGTAYAGQDVLVWFWAPWCPVCRAEGPDVARLAADYDEKVTVLGVAGLSQDTAAMADFVAASGTESLTHAADPQGEVWQAFGVTSQYDWALVDDSGDVEIVRGPLDPDELRDRLDALAAS